MSVALQTRPSRARVAGLTVIGVGSVVLIARRSGYWPSDQPLLPTAWSDNDMFRRLQSKWIKRSAYPGPADRARLDRLYELQMRQRRAEPRVTFDEFLTHSR
jgi:hypothetical protein